MEAMNDTPSNYLAPAWDEAGRVHDWRNHVSEEVQAMWGTFTVDQRAALARQAECLADHEEWE